MRVEDALALYDSGMALANVVEVLLSRSGDRQLQVATHLLRAALEMPDHSPRKVRTPIKRQLGLGCFELGDTIIVVRGSPFEGIQRRGRSRVTVWIGERDPAPINSDLERDSSYRLSHFVGQMVMLRAVCCRAIARDWLARLGNVV